MSGWSNYCSDNNYKTESDRKSRGRTTASGRKGLRELISRWTRLRNDAVTLKKG